MTFKKYLNILVLFLTVPGQLEAHLLSWLPPPLIVSFLYERFYFYILATCLCVYVRVSVCINLCVYLWVQVSVVSRKGC